MTIVEMEKEILSANMPSCILPPSFAPLKVWEEMYRKAVEWKALQKAKAEKPIVVARHNDSLTAAILRAQYKKDSKRGSVKELTEEKEHGWFNYMNI